MTPWVDSDNDPVVAKSKLWRNMVGPLGTFLKGSTHMERGPVSDNEANPRCWSPRSSAFLLSRRTSRFNRTTIVHVTPALQAVQVALRRGVHMSVLAVSNSARCVPFPIFLEPLCPVQPVVLNACSIVRARRITRKLTD